MSEITHVDTIEIESLIAEITPLNAHDDSITVVVPDIKAQAQYPKMSD